MSSVGERIRDFALDKFASVSELARAIEMKPANLLAYVNGSREPGMVVLQRLARAGANINYILTGELSTDPDIQQLLVQNKIFTKEQLEKKINPNIEELLADIEKILRNKLE